jgi:hypothetical protein
LAPPPPRVPKGDEFRAECFAYLLGIVRSVGNFVLFFFKKIEL